MKYLKALLILIGILSIPFITIWLVEVTNGIILLVMAGLAIIVMYIVILMYLETNKRNVRKL